MQTTTPQEGAYTAVTPEWAETSLGDRWDPAHEFTGVVSLMASNIPAFGTRPLDDEEIERLVGAASGRLRPFDDIECPCFVLPKLFDQYNIIYRDDLAAVVRRHCIVHEVAHIMAGHADLGKVPHVRYRQEDTIADMAALLATREPRDRDPERSDCMLADLGELWGLEGALEARHRLTAAARFLRAWEEGNHG